MSSVKLRLKRNRCTVSLLLVACALSACAKTVTGSSSAQTCGGTATVGATANMSTGYTNNTLPIYIADPNVTGNIYYDNEPVISVTICSPNHTSSSQCQTISNVLLDTGSHGLRVFSSAINSNVSLTPLTITAAGNTYNLAECEVFGIGADWGSVQSADVLVANQTATNIPVQVIDHNFGTMPGGCAAYSPDTDPCSAGYNGILGVGLFTQDCGSDCDSTDIATNPGNYFGCDDTGCYNAYHNGASIDAMAVSTQVTNPVPYFATNYNNGISVALPSIGYGGASRVSGTLTLGIGSVAGNAPGMGVQVFDSAVMADGMGEDFQTSFDGTPYGTSGGTTTSFLDSGSNCFFFAAITGVTKCGDNPFFCPSASPGSPLSLSATITGYSNAVTTGSFDFYLVSADDLFNTNNTAFSTLAAPGSSDQFDWGLPFFYGKTVYVGVDDAIPANFNGSNKTGPYWAF